MPKPPCPKQTWSPKDGTPMPSWRIAGLLVSAPTASEARARYKHFTGGPIPKGVRPVRMED